MMMLAESQYFYCKCSVCFENDSEMELINCGDQYCIPCLERYVEYRIKEGSWGILPVELSCPVCSQLMIDEDWVPYVSPRVLEVWKKFQQKRKNNLKQQQICRTCPNCHHSQPIIGGTKTTCITDEQQLSDLGMLLMNCLDCVNGTAWRTHFDLEQALDLTNGNTNDIEDLEEFFDNAHMLFDDFLNLLVKLQTQGNFTRGNEKLILLLNSFGRKFLQLMHKSVFNEEVEGAGYEEEMLISLRLSLITMQLNFQFSFPFGLCDSCGGKFCLPCERAGWYHRKHQPIQRPGGAKQCPRCFVLIEKEAEGCNEMQCNYCGMKFCWECGKKWSKECGVYKCSNRNGRSKNNISNTARVETTIVDSSSSSDESVYSDPLDFLMEPNRESQRGPEIGVPNVTQIEHRRKVFKY